MESSGREEAWSPSSWQGRRALQQPKYGDEGKVLRVVEELGRLPPLVTSWEVERLKGELAEAARGERFLLQGGDCCESFEDCQSPVIARKLKVLLQMSLVLTYGGGKPVVRVGRFAGQYAKPRSADWETKDGVTLPSYRGSNVNKVGFTPEDREPDPNLLLEGYKYAGLNLNFCRGLMEGGFADLHHPEYWNLEFVQDAEQAQRYGQVVEAIRHAVGFMERVCGTPLGGASRVEFYTSHEGLHLAYEEALTRQVPRRTGWYNLGCHFPWIGERTRGIDDAHVEYFRGLANPIGVKVGPSMTSEELPRLCERLNPTNEPGRLTLIHRFGVGKIAGHLPGLIEAVRKAGRNVLWCCDPMHGNTLSTTNGYKTRRFDDVRGELDQAFSLHAENGSVLGGVHLELTGENVTECTGGARGLSDEDLPRAYTSPVDPRLNAEQSLELAFLVAHRLHPEG